MQNKKKRKIVYIEDDSFLLDMYAYKFEQQGYIVKTILSPDLETAMKEIGEFKPDLILSDYLMPDVDGLQIVSTLNKDKDLSNIPIFLLDNFSRESIEQKTKEYKQVEYVDYLVKADFAPSEVVENIISYMDHPESYKSPYEDKEFLKRLQEEKEKDRIEWEKKYPKPTVKDRLVSFKDGVVVLLQILGVIAFIALAIWLIRALGPLWIIAILLVLILIVLSNKQK